MFELARLVLRLLDRLDVQTVDVLGLAWGGGLAQHIALLDRSRVRRLVLAATGFGFGSLPASIPAAAELLTPARYRSPLRLQRVGPQISQAPPPVAFFVRQCLHEHLCPPQRAAQLAYKLGYGRVAIRT